MKNSRKSFRIIKKILATITVIAVSVFLFHDTWGMEPPADYVKEADRTVLCPMVPQKTCYMDDDIRMPKMSRKEIRKAKKIHKKIMESRKRTYILKKNRSSTKIIDYLAIAYHSYYSNLAQWTEIQDITGDGNYCINTSQYRKYHTRKQWLSDKVEEIISSLKIDRNTTQYDALKRINDYLCNTIQYDNTLRGYSAESALIEEKATCMGYSLAMCAICDHIGIACNTVTSRDHMWNVITINGNQYYIDVCWNDTNEGGLPRTFFMIPDVIWEDYNILVSMPHKMSESHIVSTDPLDNYHRVRVNMPPCSG